MNALIKIQKGADALAEMNEIEQIIAADEVGDEDSFDYKPIVIKVASGGAKAFQTGGGDMINAPFEGHVIAAIKTRAYYPLPFGKGDSKIPMCSSIGGKVGIFNVESTDAQFEAAMEAYNPHPAVRSLVQEQPIQDAYKCDLCPLSQFGSAHQGRRGTACPVHIKMLILRDNDRMPVVLRLPTMSVDGWNELASTLVTQYGRPTWTFRYKFDIETAKSADGIPYGRISISATGPVEDPVSLKALVEARKQFEEVVKDRSIEQAIYEEEAEFVDVEAGD